MKKFVSFVAIISIIFNIFPVAFLNASSDLNASIFYINNHNNSINLSPGDKLAFYYLVQNNSGQSLTDLNNRVDFSSVTGLTYNGDTDVYVGSNFEKAENGEFTAAGFDINTGFTIANGEYYALYDANGGGITLGTGITDPVITLDAYLKAKKSGVDVESNHMPFTLNIDVRPHITDYYFTETGTSTKATTIKGYGQESRDIYVKIIDKNGCSNIDGSSVTADLSDLGIGNQTLTYDSCEADGITALFKKTGISTSNLIGQVSMPYTIFSFSDEDGNAIDPTGIFAVIEDQNIDKKENLDINVTSPGAPTVTNVGITDDYIGGSGQTTSQISFSGNQSGTYKIALDSCSQVDADKILQDYTAYTSPNQIDFTVNSSALLDGANNVLACIKNGADEVGSTTFSITKDTTNPAFVGGVGYTSSVLANDVILDFECNESGHYKIEKTSPNTQIVTAPEFTNLVGNTPYSYTIPNAVLSPDSNTFKLTCRDNAGNIITKDDIIITKSSTSPSMAGNITYFNDDDIDNSGIDGRDFHIKWDNSPATNYTYFSSWLFYILPSNTAFDEATHGSSYIQGSGDKTLNEITLNSTVIRDSLGNNLVAGGEYKVYLLIASTGGDLGTPAESAAKVITGDVVQNASVTAAKFIDGDKLELTTNAVMDTNLASHDASLVSYQIGGNSYTATSVASVNDKKIIFNIPSLAGVTNATGINLVLQANAIHSLGGGYNNLINFGNITDGVTPLINSFTNNTAALFGTFWKGSMNLGWDLSEDFDVNSTYLRITRTAGNTDSIIHNVSLNASDITSGAHTKDTDLDAQNLVCGTTYKIELYGADLEGNLATTSEILNIGYDNCAPTVPTLNTFSTSGTTDVDFTWNSSTDDSGNGSGVKDYLLQIYSGNNCATLNQSVDNIAATNKTVTLATGTYSWKISSRDNMDNLSDASECSNFIVNTDVASFSNENILNTTTSSTIYAKIGDTVQVSADITNTNIENISANLSPLFGGAFTDVPCDNTGNANITCNYVGGKATYTFPVGTGGAVTQGLKQIELKAKNISGLNQQTSTNANITLDTTVPTVGANTITYPNSGETLGGTSVDITWDTTKISDTIGLKEVELFYKGGVQADYTSIYKGPNSGSYTWDITALNTAADYSLKIVAYDNVGYTNEDTTDADFSVDKQAPTVPNNTITSPNGGEIIAGDGTYNITWNSAGITDASGLKANPITIQYTTNGTDYYEIATDLPNSGTYAWSVPKVNISTVKIKLIATDSVGNTAEDISNADFGIDSTKPNVALSFAGGGGTTPSAGSFLNNSGLAISGTSSDNHMDKIVYVFKNTTDNTYFNGTTYVVGEQINTLCTDGTASGTDNACDAIGASITPLVESGKDYTFFIRALDEAGNSVDSNLVSYSNDLVNPVLNIATADNSYIQTSLNITGTSSDSISGLSSVKIQIKRNSDNFYYNGTTFVAGLTSLDTTTSDNYANWNYNYTVPVGDAEGETYETKVISYDKAYKINNSTESIITLIKDSAGPVIVGGNDFIITPTTGSLLAGGYNTNITWNPANVTDTPSGLKANSVKLEYFNGSDYIEIASGLANSGSYTWAVPNTLNSSAIRIRFTIEDNTGLTSSQLSNAFTVDSTPPTISQVETMANGIVNGKINSLKVTFSESIKDSSVNLSHFTIGNGIGNPTGLGTGATVDDNIIILEFAETGTTASTPSLTYAGDSVEDLAGKKLENVGPISSLDKAEPRILETNIYDDNKNGKLDKIELVFSENLTSTTTLSGLTLNNAYAGMSLNALSVNNEKINIILNESDNYNTAVGALSITLNNTVYADLSSNLAGNFTNNALIDKAPPVKISAITKDTTSFGNAGFGKMDQIIMTMSENIVGANSGDFTVANLATGASINSVSSSGNEIIFEINETTDATDTAQIPTIAYTPGTLADSAGNTTETINTFNVTDAIAPVVTARETNDNDGNGKIDRIKYTFSENLNDNFGGLSITVSGYTVNSYITGIALDNIMYAVVDEQALTDSDNTPEVKILSNSSLADNVSNDVLLEPSFTTSTDKVGPVTIGARYEEGGAGVADDIMYLTFSEDITAGTIDTSVGGAGNDFVIAGGGTFGGSSTTSIISATQVSITMGAGATALSTGSSSIGIKTGALEDSLNNPSPTQGTNNQITLSGNVIINEIMFASNTNNQYIELRNLGNTIVNLENYVIENAGGNGVNITIPAGQTIGANGYYLISKTNQATSIINVAPDLVDTTLNLNPNGQNNLVLKNALSTFDSVLATYPGGDKDIPKAMERQNVPGNGLVADNWYTAESSVGFDNTTPKGTPRTANIFDSTAPTITFFTPTNNELLPATPSIKLNYSDDIVGVDDTTSTFTIQKWNGADAYGADLSGAKLNSSNITASTADYGLNILDYGKYKVTFTIDDKVGNTATQIIEFYVDEFNMTVSTQELNVGDLDAGNLVLSSAETTVTITTIGAGFDLNIDKSGLITSSSSNIIDWDGNTGFGIDIYKDEAGAITNYSGSITALNNNNLAAIAKSIDTNGNLKTYTYKIKYGAKIDGVQSAGTYNTNSLFDIDISY